jgi:hypothetical protein
VATKVGHHHRPFITRQTGDGELITRMTFSRSPFLAQPPCRWEPARIRLPSFLARLFSVRATSSGRSRLRRWIDDHRQGCLSATVDMESPQKGGPFLGSSRPFRETPCLKLTIHDDRTIGHAFGAEARYRHRNGNPDNQYKTKRGHTRNRCTCLHGDAACQCAQHHPVRHRAHCVAMKTWRIVRRCCVWV